MNKKFFILLPALGLFLGACQPTKPVDPIGPVETVTGVEVDHESLSLQIGQTSQLNASVKPISLDDRSVTWSSDHPEFASVDASGMVTAVAVGTAHIRATANADQTKFGECEVTVTPEMVTVPLLSVSEVLNSTKVLKLGANQKNVGAYYYFKGSVDSSTRGETSVSWAEGVQVKLESAGENVYYVTMGEGANKQYFEMSDDHHFAVVNTPTAGREWSWNETYATVQRTIEGTTYLPGTYQTYTTISGCNLAQAASDFFFQFVYQTEPVAPQTITLSADSDKIYQGGTLQVSAELGPVGAAGDLHWTVTGDEGKVTIDQNGLVTAAEDATLNAPITVKAAYAEDETVFGTLALTVAEVINYGTLENPLTVAEAKAVIDKFQAGSLTAEKMFVKGFVGTNHGALSTTARGDVWLTSDDGSVQKAFELYSVYADESLTVAANSLVGKEVIATGWGTNYNGTYEFSNKNAAGSYDNGIIKAITNNTRAATSIVLNPAEAFEIAQGGNKTVSATLMPYGASGEVAFAVAPANQGVTYENGKVVAAADATAGNYTLTATCGNLSETLAFTVKVNDGSVEATFSATEWATTNSATSGTTKFSSITLNNVVTISVSSGTNTGKIYGPGQSTGLWEIRCYKSESAVLTIAVASGYTLVSAEGLIGSANWDAGADTTFTVANNAVSFNNNNANFNIKSITVVYKAA